MDTKETKSTKVSLSWWPFWTAGWLFCVGFIGFGESFVTVNPLERFGVIIFSWLLWPLILGLHLAN